MMKLSSILHDKSNSASSTRAKFAIKSYSVADGYPKRSRSIVEDARIDALRNKQLAEEQRRNNKRYDFQTIYSIESSFSPDAVPNNLTLDGDNSALILIGRPDSDDRKAVKIAASVLPRLLSRATSFVEHDEFVESEVENNFDDDDHALTATTTTTTTANGFTNKGRLVKQISKRPSLPHFPKNVAELDYCNHLLIKYEPELDPRHPGYHDLEYRKRRKDVAQLAFDYKYGDPYPVIQYTELELKTWKYCYNQLKSVYSIHACKQHNSGFKALEDAGIYNEHSIPQLGQVSAFLSARTGWQLRPTAGLLTARDFLASLAFRVFQTTQYIRHHGNPEHSVEPDCVHELMGHVPMLLDPSFARFSQEIGLASLGASDSQIEKFATLYWFTVEFGLCRDEGNSTNEESRKNSLINCEQKTTTATTAKILTTTAAAAGLKCYGAGLLSSFGEMEYALQSSDPILKEFVADETAVEPYDDSEYQTTYYVASSFDNAKEKVKDYAARNLKRPFELYYDSYTNTVSVIETISQLQTIIREISDQTAKLSAATTKLVSSKNLPTNILSLSVN